MYECVYCRPRCGDSGLVASEAAISSTHRYHRDSHLAKRKFVFLLLGCGLLIGACANDSGDDTTQHRHHRHGNGHGRDQTQTVDRSDNPSPTPALGW